MHHWEYRQIKMVTRKESTNEESTARRSQRGDRSEEIAAKRTARRPQRGGHTEGGHTEGGHTEGGHTDGGHNEEGTTRRAQRGGHDEEGTTRRARPHQNFSTLQGLLRNRLTYIFLEIYFERSSLTRYVFISRGPSCSRPLWYALLSGGPQF